MVKSKREREEACHICGHYHDYEGGVPCSVCGHKLVPTAQNGQHHSAFPSEVLPGFLYLGTYDNASRCELLKALGITHILNTVPTCANLYKNSFTYHTASTTPPEFDECIEFLETARRQQTKVLVHCMSGVTRSPTVVVAYLMHLRRWRLTESFKWLKNVHQLVNLSPGDSKRLQEYEVRILGSSSVCFGGLEMHQLSQLSSPQQQPQPQQQQPTSLFSWTSPQQNDATHHQQQQQQAAAAAPFSFGTAASAPEQSQSGFSFGAPATSGGFVFGVSPS